MSESTLERLWGYSTRGYETVSIRTLNVLCRFVGYHSWDEFCDKSGNQVIESEMFSGESIASSVLAAGVRIRIGWALDRICIIRYLGGNRYIAEETIIRQCSQETLSHVSSFRREDSFNSGLTTLEII